MQVKPILFVTDANFLSHLLRCIEIARVLQLRGKKVVFAASGRYITLLEQQGFEIHPVFTNNPSHTMRATRASMMKYYDRTLVMRSIDSEIQCLKLVKPSAVIGDFRWTLKISAEYCSIPFVGIINTLWTPYYALRRSVPEKLLIRKIIGQRICEIIGPWLKEKVLVKRGKPFAHAREKLGISPLKHLNKEMCGDLNLMPDIPELFPTANLPENFKYIGPLFAHDDSLVSSDRSIPTSTPYIYVTLGSTATDRLVGLIFDAFGSLNIPVVMTTGKQPIIHTPPDNFILTDYLHGNDAYKNACLTVCHGGHGTLYQALSYGIPIIGIATHNDQQWNLDRIHSKRLGLQFNEESCTAKMLCDAYTHITTNGIYKQNCIEMRKILSNYDAPSIAADEICKFIKNPILHYIAV